MNGRAARGTGRGGNPGAVSTPQGGGCDGPPFGARAKPLGLTSPAAALLALLLAGCALPPTMVPVCAWHYDVVCRAPSLAANTGQGRDYAWEHANVCPWPRKEWPSTEMSGRSCYVFAGAKDSRQVYRYVMFP